MLVRALPTLCENIARSLAVKEISFCDMLHNVLYVARAEYSGNISLNDIRGLMLFLLCTILTSTGFEWVL